MSDSGYRYPEHVRFTCTRCGDCCRGWDVMLGPGESKRLRKLDWSARDPSLAGVEPARKLGGREALVRGEDGACVFLGAENQCRIHEEFGESEKPLMCRLYPFGFVPVGRRVAVDVSYACRGVAEERGAPIAERVPEWGALIGEPPSGGTTHRFSEKHAVEGELLWELEGAVLTLLTDREVSIAERIREVSHFMRLGFAGDPRTDAAKKLRDVMLAGVPRQLRGSPVPNATMDATQRAVFFQLLYVLLNPLPSGFHERSGKSRARELERRDRASKRYQSVSARPWFDNRELDTTFEAVPKVTAGFLEEEAGQHFVERYLTAKIVGQRFLAEGEAFSPFRLGVERLLLLYPMLLWTSRALAAESGRGDVTAAEVRRALRVLDRTYGRVRFADLPARQRKAWEFSLLETELAVAASLEMSSAL